MPTSRTVRTPKSDPAPAGASGFDASVLDALLDLGARQHQLEEFRERAEERRTAVTAAVYDRVVRDYQSRLAALRAEAAPLKRRVRAEYQKLQGVIGGLRKRLEAANLDREELEFRRDVGEIEEDEFEQKVTGPARIIDETETELTGLEAQAARFVEALGDDEEVDETPTPVPAPAPPLSQALADTTPPTMLADFPGDNSPTMSVMAEGATLLVTDPIVMGAGSDTGELGATEYLPPEAIMQAAAAEASMADAGQTISLPDAMLVLEEDGGTTEFPLSMLSYIGRSEGNQVQLARAGVSRRHAMITVAADGRYAIQDLQSQNGTFLNGERITEATLNDGDRIAVGDVEVTFRSGVR